MLGMGALSIIFVAIPLHAADLLSYPPRLPVRCPTPADVGLHYEEVSFPTADGLTLRGWFIPGQNGAAILFARGGAGGP
jgi:uncharacterized protein